MEPGNLQDWIPLLAVESGDEATISELLSRLRGNRSAEFGAVAFPRPRLNDPKCFLLLGLVFEFRYYSIGLHLVVSRVMHLSYLVQRCFGSVAWDSKGVEYS